MSAVDQPRFSGLPVRAGACGQEDRREACKCEKDALHRGPPPLPRTRLAVRREGWLLVVNSFLEAYAPRRRWDGRDGLPPWKRRPGLVPSRHARLEGPRGTSREGPLTTAVRYLASHLPPSAARSPGT